ncbi:hypothetical protein [Sphingomonas sp.]|uniref:hypothetical protein n=1 Tax=Sphingomonas sp. TaxID=28214 RepID=UPI0025D003CA|nr:hypothetical protein [Sphingomonas sp.]MBV9528199.1 hypothetical protein [Sphingomonas sp.]
MSKGAGHVMRAILQVVDGEPDRSFDVDELCRRAYPDVAAIELKHRQAVIRALRRMVPLRSDLGLRADGYRPGARGTRLLVVYRLGNRKALAHSESRTWDSWYEAKQASER